MSGKDRLHNELVLVDQSQICQRQGERHATHPQALAWLLLEPLNRLPQVASHQLGMPNPEIDRTVEIADQKLNEKIVAGGSGSA